MKTSEVVAVWKRYGVSEEQLRHTLLGYGLYEVGVDNNLRTTSELMAISEAFEKDNAQQKNAPQDCTSCNGDLEDWTYGHRPDWWVCAQCRTVFPHYCEVPDAVGKCRTCGRLMSVEAIERHYAEVRAERDYRPTQQPTTSCTVSDEMLEHLLSQVPEHWNHSDG